MNRDEAPGSAGPQPSTGIRRQDGDTCHEGEGQTGVGLSGSQPVGWGYMAAFSIGDRPTDRSGAGARCAAQSLWKHGLVCPAVFFGDSCATSDIRRLRGAHAVHPRPAAGASPCPAESSQHERILHRKSIYRRTGPRGSAADCTRHARVAGAGHRTGSRRCQAEADGPRTRQ